MKDPLDDKNANFVSLIEERKNTVKDFTKVNKEKVSEISDLNAVSRPSAYIKSDPEPGEVYMYSGQKLNYTEHMKWKLANEFLQDPSHFYTLSPDYLTLSWPLIDDDKIKAQEREKFANTRLKYK